MTELNYILETKAFYKILDFEEEILNWRFERDLSDHKYITIGHPINSHKGNCLGDKIAYTKLPELLKHKYPHMEIYCHEDFYDLFKFNPYVSGIRNDPFVWGSLGTWGNTIQRTCNVFGCHDFDFNPIIYVEKDIIPKEKSILICTRSKNGGIFKNYKLIDSILYSLREMGYYIVQLEVKNERHSPACHEYVFNADYDLLVNTIQHCEYYIGAPNSIYHLAKGLGRKVIGIIPEDMIDPFYVMLPLLTQTNYREIEMLSDNEKLRSVRFLNWLNTINQKNIDHNISHLGWLYPDIPHLSLHPSAVNYSRCPNLDLDNLLKAMNNQIYPFGNKTLWDVTNSLWSSIKL